MLRVKHCFVVNNNFLEAENLWVKQFVICLYMRPDRSLFVVEGHHPTVGTCVPQRFYKTTVEELERRTYNALIFH